MNFVQEAFSATDSYHVNTVEEIQRHCDSSSLSKVNVPIKILLVSLRWSQRNRVHFTKASRENVRGRGMVAKPISASGFSVVAVYSDHDVTIIQDLRNINYFK
jgi:hypothetical protein